MALGQGLPLRSPPHAKPRLFTADGAAHRQDPLSGRAAARLHPGRRPDRERLSGRALGRPCRRRVDGGTRHRLLPAARHSRLHRRRSHRGAHRPRPTPRRDATWPWAGAWRDVAVLEAALLGLRQTAAARARRDVALGSSLARCRRSRSCSSLPTPNGCRPFHRRIATATDASAISLGSRAER